MFKSYLWLLHRLTGFLLIFFLLSHIFYMHYGKTSFYSEDIILRLKNIEWKFFYAIFLVCGIYHGFYGITIVLKEHVKNKFLFKLGILIATVMAIITLAIGVLILR